MARTPRKLGHQAPKWWRYNTFNSIIIDIFYNEDRFSFCRSHNFVVDYRKEEEKLYNAEPCVFTDVRYSSDIYNSSPCYIFYRRWKPISLKACIRRTNNVRNIPLNTIVTFKKSWYIPGKKVNLSYLFKTRKENFFNPQYEINDISYRKEFEDPFYNKLVSIFREKGFLVQVASNTHFIHGKKLESQIGIAYGNGLMIGFSDSNSFRGYLKDKDEFLFDKYGEFDKWSRTERFQSSNIDDIISFFT